MSLPGTTTRVICNRCGRATDQAGGHDTTAGCIGSYPLIQRRIFSEPNVTIGAVGGGALRETASEPFAQSELGNAADNWAMCYADAIDSAHHEDVDAYDAAAGFVAGYVYRKHEERPDPSFSPSKCSECSDYDPAMIASCRYCGKSVCDGCYAARHEHKKCVTDLRRRQLIHAALSSAVEWMADDGCDCGGGDDPECALCLCRAALSELEIK